MQKTFTYYSPHHLMPAPAVEDESGECAISKLLVKLEPKNGFKAILATAHINEFYEFEIEHVLSIDMDYVDLVRKNGGEYRVVWWAYLNEFED